MAKPSMQLNLPPTEVNRVGSPMPTGSNEVGSVDLASLVLKAGDALGMQDKELAGLFELSPADFSSAFSPARTDRNRLMKQRLPLLFARELALALCQATGLVVSGPDAQRHAAADLIVSATNFLRVAR